jgi:hypothetical protein
MSGIHEHPTLKLGLKPHGKDADELLHVGWRAGQPPAYEAKVDRLSQITIGLDGNDKYGDCGPTSSDNHRRATTKALTGAEADATQAQVFDLYSRSTNPPFDPKTGANDNGVDMVTMCAALKSGGLAGVKIVAYAKLEDTSDASVYAAIDLFGAVLFAVDLQTAQQDQSDAKNPVWDYKRSADWGGHAIVAGAYDSTTGIVTVGSWGTAIGTTKAFRLHQLDEVWVPIWPELLGSARFVAAVDTAALAADFQSLTGGTLPVAPAPAPTPTPTPVPTPPGGGASFQLDAAVEPHVGRAAKLASLTEEQWINRHFHGYFHVGASAHLMQVGDRTIARLGNGCSIHVWRSENDGQHYMHVTSRSGQILTSSEGYQRRDSAWGAARVMFPELA